MSVQYRERWRLGAPNRNAYSASARSLPLPVLYQCCLVRVRDNIPSFPCKMNPKCVPLRDKPMSIILELFFTA